MKRSRKCGKCKRKPSPKRKPKTKKFHMRYFENIDNLIGALSTIFLAIEKTYGPCFITGSAAIWIWGYILGYRCQIKQPNDLDVVLTERKLTPLFDRNDELYGPPGQFTILSGQESTQGTRVFYHSIHVPYGIEIDMIRNCSNINYRAVLLRNNIVKVIDLKQLLDEYQEILNDFPEEIDVIKKVECINQLLLLLQQSKISTISDLMDCK